jgi:hypothetical protein
MTRARLALPIVLLYWLMLLTGLAFFTAIRIDNVWAVLPLWAGSLGGTALGQVLALRNFRLWAAIGIMGAVMAWSVPALPPELSSTELWMAFVPAALCGFFCLADRAALAAFWFPAVIWMLSILDGTGAQATPDGAGIVLLGALAVLFIVFLRAREARRVALWRTIAATPLATGRPSAVLKEPPGRQLARGTWAILVSAITFGVTAWVAPYLWQTESFDAGPTEVADPSPGHGLPCCPVQWDAEVTRSRVPEYFDIGRGHDEITGPPRKGIDCQVCEGAAIGEVGSGGDVIAGGGSIGGDGVIGGDPLSSAPAIAAFEGRHVTPGQADPWESAPVLPSAPPTAAPTATVEVPAVAPAPVPAAVDPVAPVPPQVEEAQAPQAAAPTPPPAPAPVIESPPPPAPQRTEPAPATAAPSPATAHPGTLQRHRPAASDLGPVLLHWIAVIVAAALLFQMVSLGLRPLRRWITLRHLRRPFWDETIDQRVSNAWQLALVGLRDAGWRSTSTEAPREFAHRAGAQGLERCATILERARHGIAIDAGDLSEMAASAEAVYRSARGNVGAFARAIAWLRWPLT